MSKCHLPLVTLVLVLAAAPTSAADLIWAPTIQSVTYTVRTIDKPGQPESRVFLRSFSADFSSLPEVRLGGDLYAPLGQVFAFDAARLAVPTAENSFVPGDVAWVQLPATGSDVVVGMQYSLKIPENPEPDLITIQSNSVFTPTSVGPDFINYNVQHFNSLIRSSGLSDFMSSIAPPAASTAAVLAPVQDILRRYPVADCNGTYNVALGVVEAVACDWQAFPGATPWTMDDLRRSPNRLIIFVERTP